MTVLAPPPPQDELEALIREARERQLRRRLLGAASVAIAAAVGLSVYGLLLGNGAPKTPSASAGTPPPLCRASQLSVAMFFEGATQTMLGGARITNTGATTCSFPRGRPVVAVSWHGRTWPVRERPMPSSTAPPWHRVRVLAPGATASVFLQWWDQWFCAQRLQDWSFDPRFELRFTGLTVFGTATRMPVPDCGKPGGRLDVSRPLVQR
jgi:hypothetical protein